ncbi:hypothetical protein BGZ72_000636 [Mortierella alpina]|nr:hypothetical protein BGZ72_000636 [Mortierella alpina]
MDPRRGATSPVYAAPADSLALPPLSSLALVPAAKELLHTSPSAHSYQEMLLHHPARDPDHPTPSPLSSVSPVSFSPIPPSRIPKEASHPTSALVTPWPRQLPSEPQLRHWDVDRLDNVQGLGSSTRPFAPSSASEEASSGPIDPWARNYSLQTQITLPATTFGSNAIHHLACPVVFDRGSYSHRNVYPHAADASGAKSSGGGFDSTRSPLDSHGKFGPSRSQPGEGPEGRLEHTLANRDDLPSPRPRSARGAEARYYGDVIEEIEDDLRMSTHQGFTPSHSYLHSYARSRPQRELLHQIDQPPHQHQQHQQQLQLDATPHRHSGSHTYSTAAPEEGYIAHNQRHNLDHGSLDRISLREGSARTLSEHPSASSLQYHASHPHPQNTQYQSHQQHQHHQQNKILSLRDPTVPSLPPVSALSTWEPPFKEHHASSLGKIAKNDPTVDLTPPDQRGQPLPLARIERLSGEQTENQVGTQTDAQRSSAQALQRNLQRNLHATQPFTIPAFNPPSAQPYRSSHSQQTPQHLGYSSPTPSCPAHSPKYVPPSEYRPVSPPPSFKQSDSNGSQYQREGTFWANQTNEAQHPSQQKQKCHDDHVQNHDHDGDDKDGPSRKSSRRFRDLRFKFGTDMPKTVDLKAAIESCDLLCKFALHYASQETKDSRLDPSMVSFENARDRATLQTIRTLNSTILIGSQNNGRNEDTEKRRRSSLRQSMADEPRPMRTKEANVNGGEGRDMDDDGDDGDDDDADDGDDDNGDDDDDDEDDDNYTQFGHNPPSHEMVHELAKAATSIFQLAIRIKAWVGMTPEERVLDEDINTIRGKRCLFMDGSSMMRMTTLDPHSQQGKEWAVIQAKASSQGIFRSPGVPEHTHHGFKRPNESDVEMRSADRWDYPSQSTPVGSYPSNAPSFSPMDSSAGDMMFDRAKLTSDPGSKTLGSTEDNGRDGDAPPQKYRKRAKRTQPPDYAKLLKRQNQQQAKQLQEQQAKQRVLHNSEQKVVNGMDSDDKKPADIQLQTIKFQFPRRPLKTPPRDDATSELMDQDSGKPS